MSKIKIGIIGAGYIAQEHLKVIKKINNFSVMGITSRTSSKAETLASKFDINNVYEDYQSMIDECSLDGIMILVSAEKIFKITKELIPYKIPLFIEKPAGLNPEETKILLSLSNEYQTINLVGYNRRFYSIFHKGLDLIAQMGGLIGIAAEGHERFWKIPKEDFSEKELENWFYANSTHTIDLLRLFGGEVDQINTFKNSLIEKNGDQFVASFRFNSGTIGTYTSHWYSPGGWSVKLYCKEATLEFKPLESGLWIDKDFEQHQILPDEVDLKYKPGFYNQMLAFRNMIINRKLDWPGIDLNETLKTMKLAQNFIDG